MIILTKFGKVALVEQTKDVYPNCLKQWSLQLSDIDFIGHIWLNKDLNYTISNTDKQYKTLESAIFAKLEVSL